MQWNGQINIFQLLTRFNKMMSQTDLACSDRVCSTAYSHHWEQAGAGANVQHMGQLAAAMYDLFHVKSPNGWNPTPTNFAEI